MTPTRELTEFERVLEKFNDAKFIEDLIKEVDSFFAKTEKDPYVIYLSGRFGIMVNSMRNLIRFTIISHDSMILTVQSLGDLEYKLKYKIFGHSFSSCGNAIISIGDKYTDRITNLTYLHFSISLREKEKEEDVG